MTTPTPTTTTTPSLPLPQLDLSEGKTLPNANHDAYSLVEIFSSCEGEGVQAGIPMTFVRFSKCNLACDFCDTPYNRVAFKTSEAALAGIITEQDPAWVKFTGGEPTMQLRGTLIQSLKTYNPNVKCCMETNGMLWSDAIPLLDYVVMSPKRHYTNITDPIPAEKWVAKKWLEHDRGPDELRFIITGPDDDWFGEHPMFLKAKSLVFSPVFDPVDLPVWHKSGMGHPGCKGVVDPVALNQCLRLVDKYKHLGARLSVQVHKMIGAR